MHNVIILIHHFKQMASLSIVEEPDLYLYMEEKMAPVHLIMNHMNPLLVKSTG